ncbi:MAG: hypothetical protein PIR02_09525 [Microbacterium enclense]
MQMSTSEGSLLARERGKRSALLVAAIAALVIAVSALFWRTGSCADFAASAGVCQSGLSAPAIVFALVFGVAAVWLFAWWLRVTRRE